GTRGGGRKKVRKSRKTSEVLHAPAAEGADEDDFLAVASWLAEYDEGWQDLLDFLASQEGDSRPPSPDGQNGAPRGEAERSPGSGPGIWQALQAVLGRCLPQPAPSPDGTNGCAAQG